MKMITTVNERMRIISVIPSLTDLETLQVLRFIVVIAYNKRINHECKSNL